MLKPLGAVFVLALLPIALNGQSAGTVQKDLQQHAQKLKSWTLEPLLQTSVKTQNAKAVPLVAIQNLDAAWVAKKNETFVLKIITGPCADRLRALALKHGYGEVLVIDNQGVLVCATGRTTDYWQGDEAKWIKAFNEGKGAIFIDRPRHDDSSQSRQAQISIPFMDGERAIGVLTVGVVK